MKTLKVTFESGKVLKYTGSFSERMAYRVRIMENEERRARFGQETDKAIKFETVECEY
jgi:hypothetical protein